MRLASVILVFGITLAAPAQDAASLRKAVTLYASFDEKVAADYARGEGVLFTRSTDEKDKNQLHFKKGFDDKVLRIGKGIAGGALETSEILPHKGRVYFPAKGNLAFKKDGWSGALSVWINTDPNKLLKTPFCDPIQITQKGANNGGIWFDFNDAKPMRDLRMGVFPAAKEGQKPLTETQADAPMVRVPGPLVANMLKEGKWRHVALTWKNLDTGKADAHCSLYIDGKHLGDIKDRPLAMEWDIEKAGIYVAISYIGLLDELALFERSLTAEEVRMLHEHPGLLQALKK